MRFRTLIFTESDHDDDSQGDNERKYLFKVTCLTCLTTKFSLANYYEYKTLTLNLNFE